MPAVREHREPERLPRLVDPREHLEDEPEVGEQQQHEQRDVADDLDVDAAHGAQHRVVRQPADADQRAEDGREDEAGDRDAQRVEEALVRARCCTGAVGDIELPGISKFDGRSRYAEVGGDVRPLRRCVR